MTKQLWNIFLAALIVGFLIKNELQDRRIEELEAKATLSAATDETFWQVVERFYRLEASLQ